MLPSAPTDSGVMISYVARCFSTPSWWMPASCEKALAPTMALFGATYVPVHCCSSRDARVSCVVSMRVCAPANSSGRVCSAITTSSSDAFPARSPMPFSVTSTCRAPARMPASVFDTASPRSS